MTRTPDGKVRWERPKPVTPTSDQGGLFADLATSHDKTVDTEPKAINNARITRARIGNQYAFVGFIEDKRVIHEEEVRNEAKEETRLAPTTPPKSPKLLLPTKKSPESKCHELEVILIMEDMMGLTEESRHQIQLLLNAALEDAIANMVVIKKGSKFMIKRDDLIKLKSIIGYHYKDDFTLEESQQKGEITFSPVVNMSEQDYQPRQSSTA